MKATSDLTSKILAYKELPGFNMDDTIDWALDMMRLGYETPSLLILASISKPTNFYEAQEYLVSACKELGIQIPNREEALYEYCKYFISGIARSENVRANLSQLYKIAHIELDDKPIFDFYLLYWAWDDLDYNSDYQHYWEGATLENIESIVIDTAKKWILIY
jgi:hypothetical protein